MEQLLLSRPMNFSAQPRIYIYFRCALLVYHCGIMCIHTDLIPTALKSGRELYDSDKLQEVLLSFSLKLVLLSFSLDSWRKLSTMPYHSITMVELIE